MKCYTSGFIIIPPILQPIIPIPTQILTSKFGAERSMGLNFLIMDAIILIFFFNDLLIYLFQGIEVVHEVE